MNKLIYKVLYFLMFGAYGVLLPYLPVFFESLNISNAQIGTLMMIPNIASFTCAPLWSAISDTYNISGEVLGGTLIGSTLLTLAMLRFRTYKLQAIIFTLNSVVRAPLISLLDAITITSLDDPSTYGQIRLWGAVSFGLMSFVGGVITTPSNKKGEVDTSGGGGEIQFPYLFYLYGVFAIVSLLPLLRILYNNKRSQSEADEKAKHAHESSVPPSSQSTQLSSTQTVLKIIKSQPSVLVFSMIVFLSGFGTGVIDSFLFIRLKGLGASGVLMGLARVVMCVAEIPMFQLSGYFQNKFGVWLLLTLTQFAFVVRFVYYTMLTNPWVVLPCELLNGCTYAITWSVACNYANMISPKETKSTMQSLLEGLHWGLGSGCGSFFGGLLYDRLGPVKLFMVCGLLSTVSSLLGLMAYLCFAPPKTAEVAFQELEMKTLTKSSSDLDSTVLLSMMSDEGTDVESAAVDVGQGDHGDAVGMELDDRGDGIEYDDQNEHSTFNIMSNKSNTTDEDEAGSLHRRAGHTAASFLSKSANVKFQLVGQSED